MTPAELDRLSVLRDFKAKMPRADLEANVTPFQDRVSTAAGGPSSGDLPDIHAAVRDHIRTTIEGVRDGRTRSQVVLVSGPAGVGKTHLLRSFASPEAVELSGHVFVGGSNSWSIREFQSQLLDWVIEALTAPSPSGEHALLDRIRAIGFRAAEHLLANPVSWKTCLARHRGGRLGRLRDYWSRPPLERLKKLAADRDPQVFYHFDFATFSDYVCDRFLVDRSNLSHRFALRVLLIYLFADKVETGIGSRERLLHWFRGRSDTAYFVRRLGASETLDRAYTRFDVIKLFAHLFSPAVSEQLTTPEHASPPRVLLFTFDQAEGRDELFDSEADWKDFFAHLSELYNTLPNVVVLFTMTPVLRSRLHGLMERQFQDRIRMEPKFALELPSPEQMLALYRARLQHWLRDDPTLQARYARLEDPFLPLGREAILAAVASRAVRAAFAELDSAFRDRVSAIAVEAQLDYVFDRNERKNAETATTEWAYTQDHVGTVRTLLEATKPVLEAAYRIELREMVDSEVTGPSLGTTAVLRLVFAPLGAGQTVTVHLARLGNYYKNHIGALIDNQLYGRLKARNFLWVVRAQPMSEATESVPGDYLTQFLPGTCGVEVQSAFDSLIVVTGKRASYTAPGQVEALDELIRQEVAKTYLGKLFAHARQKLDALAAPSPESVSTEV